MLLPLKSSRQWVSGQGFTCQMLWLGLPGDTEGNVGLLVFSINEILYHSSVPDPWRKSGLLEKAGLVVFVVDVVLEINT